MPQTRILAFCDKKGRTVIADWLDTLEAEEPDAYAKCLQRVLHLESMGYELRRPQADSLRDGIHELRCRNRNVHYRILYFFSGQNVAVLSHGLTKEDKVPDGEIDKAVKHKELVDSDLEKYTTDEWT